MICALDDKPSVIIQDKSVFNPYSKDIFIPNVYVDDDAHPFETPRTTITVSLHQGPIIFRGLVILGFW